MLEISTHKQILIKILQNIYSDPEIGPILGLKGGTALYLFYGLPRFSVDLDFDLIDSSKENLIYKKIENIIKRFGTIKEAYIKKHTIFFMLSYSEKAQNIKIEISRRIFGSQYELKNYIGIPMLVMVKEDMAAHKLVAKNRNEIKRFSK